MRSTRIESSNPRQTDRVRRPVFPDDCRRFPDDMDEMFSTNVLFVPLHCVDNWNITWMDELYVLLESRPSSSGVLWRAQGLDEQGT